MSETTNRSESGSSEQPTAVVSSIDPMRNTIVLWCTLMLILGMGCTIDFVYLGSAPIPRVARIAIVILILWLVNHSNIVVLFGIMVTSLILRDPTRLKDFDLSVSIINVLVSLGLLYWMVRYQSIRRTVCEVACDFCDVNRESQSNRESTDKIMLAIQSGIEVGLKLICVVLLAIAILFNQPWTTNTNAWLQWSLTNKQVLWPGPLLIVIVIGLIVVVNEFGWRRKTTGQKKLTLRCNSVRILYPDMQRIVRHRIKRRG
jgi:lysylphosphatidylglycerol synthetase-like protein (DUF2156 family)